MVGLILERVIAVERLGGVAKNVSLTAIGRFVATRAAAMTTDPAAAEAADPPKADVLDGADSDAMDTAHNL